MSNRLDQKYPSIAAMEQAAARRIPRFAFDYLQGGIGAEFVLTENRHQLNRIKLIPRYLIDNVPDVQMQTSLLGKNYGAPFAPSPLGLSGLMWPRAAELIARGAKKNNLPVGLSTFATSSIEEVAAIAGDHLWFQLYCCNTPEIEQDLIDRAEAAGAGALIVTIDIPTFTRRERDIANGLSVPPQFNFRTIAQALARPSWALKTLAAGIPQFRNLLPYVPQGSTTVQAATFLSDLIEVFVTKQKLKALRERWKERLIVKGVLDINDALFCKEIGVDAIVVSNHGGRQLDAAPAAPEVLPAIRSAIGANMPIIADGGVRTGLDIARLLALGADFVLLGRPFVYAAATREEQGIDHLISILKEELRQTMVQLGCSDFSELNLRLESSQTQNVNPHK